VKTCTEELNKKNAKYILLEGLERKNRFFCINRPEESEDSIVRNIHTGEVVYKILGYANTMKDAQMQLYGFSSTERDD